MGDRMTINETKLDNMAEWRLETITRWGQRANPPIRSIIIYRESMGGAWVSDENYTPADTIGVYLGGNTVMVFPPVNLSKRR